MQRQTIEINFHHKKKYKKITFQSTDRNHLISLIKNNNIQQ